MSVGELSTGDHRGGDHSASSAPFLRVISTNATAEDVAAIVAVLASMGGAPPTPEPASAWSDPARMHRGPADLPQPGPHGWWRSGLPV